MQIKALSERVKVQLQLVRIFMLPYPLTNFEIQKIIKTNLNLMVSIQEKIYLKQLGIM